MATKTYKRALASAKVHGWAHADKAAIEAAMADALGRTHCMQPEAIYKWAAKHGVSLFAERKRLTPLNDVLLIAVLNDLPICSVERAIN